MRKLAMGVFLFSTAALAHEGHGALPVHLHWWEYGLLATLVAGVVMYVAKK